MHPLYLVDYIEAFKSETTASVEYLHQALKGIQETETAMGNKYSAIELEWLMTSVIREAHLFKHHLHQLEKGIEKIANQPIQNELC